MNTAIKKVLCNLDLNNNTIYNSKIPNTQSFIEITSPEKILPSDIKEGDIIHISYDVPFTDSTIIKPGYKIYNIKILDTCSCSFTAHKDNIVISGNLGIGITVIDNITQEVSLFDITVNSTTDFTDLYNIINEATISTIDNTTFNSITNNTSCAWFDSINKYYIYHNGTILSIDPDTELSSTSSNVVLNKVITAALNNKVDKVDGKQLSTNDYTTEEKTKLDGLNNYDDTSVKASISTNATNITNEITRAKAAEKTNSDAITTEITRATTAETTNANNITTLQNDLKNKQNILVSGTSIKTINGNSLLGSGDITITSGGNVDLSAYTTKTYVDNADAILQTNINTKVDKITGKLLSTEDYTTTEKTKLAGLNNYDDTSIKTSIETKVDKVSGKSLVSDTEITRLSSVKNYDDTAIKNSISDETTRAKMAEETLQTNIDTKQSTLVSGTNIKTINGNSILGNGDITISDSRDIDLSNYALKTYVDTQDATKVDKVTGKSLISDTEITRLASVTNYDDSTIKTSISNKVDKVTGKSLISDSEIIRLANVSNYDDSTITKSITDETSARKTADTTLQTNIDTKVDKVTGKSLISDTEITRLASIKNYDDTTIATNITNEITRAKAAEKANADNITALQTTVNSANTEIVSITSVIGGLI